VILQRDLAFVCRDRNKDHKAKDIKAGAVPMVTVDEFQGVRLSGTVLAASKESIFMLHGKEIIVMPRTNPAFSSLSDREAAALVGWPHSFVMQSGRAAKLELPESGSRLVPPTLFAGKQVAMRVLRPTTSMSGSPTVSGEPCGWSDPIRRSRESATPSGHISRNRKNPSRSVSTAPDT